MNNTILIELLIMLFIQKVSLFIYVEKIFKEKACKIDSEKK